MSGWLWCVLFVCSGWVAFVGWLCWLVVGLLVVLAVGWFVLFGWFVLLESFVVEYFSCRRFWVKTLTLTGDKEAIATKFQTTLVVDKLGDRKTILRERERFRPSHDLVPLVCCSKWKAEMSAQMTQVNARFARLSIGEQPSSAAKTYATSFKEYEARSKPIIQPEFDFTTNKSGWERFQEMLQEFQVCMETLFVLVTYFSFSTTML